MSGCRSRRYERRHAMAIRNDIRRLSMNDQAEADLNADRQYESIWTHLSKVAFKQDWIDAGGVWTRYAQAGPSNAPAVVMLHGTGGTWEAYCATLASHSRYFNCFALDFIGSGYTAKPLFDYQIADYVKQVKDFIGAVGLEKASIMGISLG